MNKTIFKSFNTRLLLCCGFLIFTAIIIHSCKKDNKNQLQEADITDPNVLAAQTWYNTSYPASATTSTTTTQATQSTGAQQASTDWSKIISPYWSKAAAFTSKKGLNIVEAPALKKGDMAFARNMPANLSKYDFSQSGSLTSMLILKQGNQYAAYAMTIMGDSSYIKGDYTKLANNTYRKKDKDFTGWVLYHQLNGAFVNGWRYVNGKVTAAAHYNPGTATSTQAVQSISSPKVNVLQTCDITIVWHIFSLCSYAISDVTLSNSQDCTYIARFAGAYSTCTDDPATDPGGDPAPPPPPPCVPPAGGSTAPAAVNGRTTLALKANKQTILVAQPTDPPPTDPNGEIVPVLLCPVDITTVDTAKVDTLTVTICPGLTSAERDSIRSTVAAFKTEDCVSKYLTGYFNSSVFGFCIDVSNPSPNYTVHYIPGTKSFMFATDAAASSDLAYLLEHEFFHAYQDQNAFYPNGIANYGKDLTTGIASPGYVNVEFEQAVFHDIASGNVTAFSNGTPDQQSRYSSWIATLTSNGTAYPKLSTGTSGYNNFLTSYTAFLNEFNAIPGNVYSSAILNFSPNALINLFNNTNPNCQ